MERYIKEELQIPLWSVSDVVVAELLEYPRRWRLPEMELKSFLLKNSAS